MTNKNKEQITRDLQGLDVNDSNSNVRRFFRLFIEGSYANGNGEQVQAENLRTLEGIWSPFTNTTQRQLRSWAINQFVRNCMADYGGSYSHVQKCIVESMPEKELAGLTEALVNDSVEWMLSQREEV